MNLHRIYNIIKKTITLILLLYSHITHSQTDTITIPEVTVTSYPATRPLLHTPASIALLAPRQLALQQNASLVAAVNTVPGVRMEERSPGSYRLSIRGSLLRSPFGVRNVKVYLDEFALTNASGDTYLNLLDKYAIGKMEIVKGPDGSLFGANSGGVVRITPVVFADSLTVELNAEGGSYKMWHVHGAAQVLTPRTVTAISQSLHYSDGYRDNSDLERKYFQAANRWKYHPSSQLRTFFFYSNLYYRTPGGLTAEQYDINAQQARPATATLPGAAQQKAGVMNETFYGGIANESNIGKRLRHVFALFASHTDFENPFITNYETRDEFTFGIRTYLEATATREKTNWKFHLGAEAQQTSSEISNYRNNSGTRDTLHVADNLKARNSFVFAQASVQLLKSLIVEASASINLNRLYYTNVHPVARAEQRITFHPQVMPRIALAYTLRNSITWRAVVSRGYSTPTISEVRSSDNSINTALQPESGWNYELGYRLRLTRIGLWSDIAVFYYHLQNAIVTRVNDAGQEYFINAGGTRQPGIEWLLNFDIIAQRSAGGVRQFTITNSYTWHPFTFRNYRIEASDYSGNRLTGVPRHTNVSSLLVRFAFGFYLFGQTQYTTGIPLNDANTTFAQPYVIVQTRAGWEKHVSKRLTLGIFFFADNLLDSKYSLGNDLNAAGGRYFNTAPGRNFAGGVRIMFR